MTAATPTFEYLNHNGMSHLNKYKYIYLYIQGGSNMTGSICV